MLCMGFKPYDGGRSRIHWAMAAALRQQTSENFYFLKNGPSPVSFSFIFGLFQTNINKILQQINVKKCPSGIQHWDSNPRPLEHESPPITTRPGLPRNFLFTKLKLHN